MVQEQHKIGFSQQKIPTGSAQLPTASGEAVDILIFPRRKEGLWKGILEEHSLERIFEGVLMEFPVDSCAPGGWKDKSKLCTVHFQSRQKELSVAKVSWNVSCDKQCWDQAAEGCIAAPKITIIPFLLPFYHLFIFLLLPFCRKWEFKRLNSVISPDSLPLIISHSMNFCAGKNYSSLSSFEAEHELIIHFHLNWGFLKTFPEESLLAKIFLLLPTCDHCLHLKPQLIPHAWEFISSQVAFSHKKDFCGVQWGKSSPSQKCCTRNKEKMAHFKITDT